MKMKIALIAAVSAFCLSLGLLIWAFFFVSSSHHGKGKTPQVTFTPPPMAMILNAKPAKFLIYDIDGQLIPGASIEAYLSTDTKAIPAARGTSDSNGAVTLQLPFDKPIPVIKTAAAGFKQNTITQVPLTEEPLEIYLDPIKKTELRPTPASVDDQQEKPQQEKTPHLTAQAFFAHNNTREPIAGEIQYAWYTFRKQNDGSTRWQIASKVQTESTPDNGLIPLEGIDSADPVCLEITWNGLIAESETLSMQDLPPHPVQIIFTKPEPFTVSAIAAHDKQPVTDLTVKMIRQRTPRMFNYDGTFYGRAAADTPGQATLDLPYGDFKIEAGAPMFSTGTLMTKCAPAYPASVQMRLQPQTPGIEVRVLDGDTPLRNAPLTLTSRFDDRAKSQFGNTDNAGKFFFADLKPGTTYTVAVSYPGAPLRQLTTDIHYSENTMATGTELIFEPVLQFSGDLHTKDGKMITAKTLTFTKRGKLEKEAVCDVQTNGYWAVELSPGEYVVSHDGDTPDTTHINITKTDAVKPLNLVFDK